jgi:hypothetical protein
MGNKVILITLITLIATAGFLLIKSDSPITIAGETLGAEPAQLINYQAPKDSDQSTRNTEDSKKQK